LIIICTFFLLFLPLSSNSAIFVYLFTATFECSLDSLYCK